MRGGDDGHSMAEMVRWFAYRRDHLLEIGEDEYLNTRVSGPGGSPLPGLLLWYDPRIVRIASLGMQGLTRLAPLP